MAATLALRTDFAPVAAEPAARAAFDIEIRTQPADFLALRAEWDALFARAAQPHQVFQSHVFLRHWLDHYLGPDDRLCLITARCDGRLAMIWPLVRQRRFGFSMLRFMGAPVAQFGDVLIERNGQEAALLKAGWDALCGLDTDLFELRKLRADAALAAQGLPDAALLLERREAPLADLATRVGPDGPSPLYAARERSNHRRRLRRLAERGEIAFEMPEPGADAAGLAREAIAMKKAALARHAVLAPTIADPRFAAFFATLAQDADSPLRLTVIRCAGEPIAIDLSLDCKGTAFGHVIATHPEHERGGVGGILVHRAFAGARERGNRRFDLLAPADAYKLEHADGITVVDDLVLPLSLKGRLLARLGLRHLRPALRAALRRLPPPVTRRIASWSGAGKN
jgi:CelD/BcsL family acetyltransferase involved in cellulose biosynthesis